MKNSSVLPLVPLHTVHHQHQDCSDTLYAEKYLADMHTLPSDPESGCIDWLVHKNV